MRGATDECRAQLCGTAHRWAAQDAALRPGRAQCPHAANRRGAYACRTSHPRQLVSCTRRQKGLEKQESRSSLIWPGGRGGSSSATSCAHSWPVWGRSRSARYFGGGGGRYPILPNGSSMNNVTPTAAGRQAAGCPSVRAFGLLVRRIPRVVLSKAGVTTCSSGSGENWWLSITPGISTEKTRWWPKVSSWLPHWRRSTWSSRPSACGTRCFTEKGLPQCAGVDFNAPQGPWKMPQPVKNLTVRPF